MIYRVPLIFTWIGEAEIEADSPEKALEIAKGETPDCIGWEGETNVRQAGDIYEWDMSAQLAFIEKKKKLEELKAEFDLISKTATNIIIQARA